MTSTTKNTGTGRNYIGPHNTNISDDNGHGTAVAGIIGAETNNGTDVAGMSWGAMIMPVKRRKQQAMGLLRQSINGIRYSVEQSAEHARIINLSTGASVSGFGRFFFKMR